MDREAVDETIASGSVAAAPTASGSAAAASAALASGRARDMLQTQRERYREALSWYADSLFAQAVYSPRLRIIIPRESPYHNTSRVGHRNHTYRPLEPGR